jgi:cysteinyl-tRNA synthetase
MLFIGIHHLLKKFKTLVGIFITVSISIGFISYTILRNQDWKNNLSIYKAGVKRCPNSVKTHFNLGTAYIVEADKTSDVLAKSQLFFAAKEEMEASERCYANYPLIYENYGYIIGELAKLEDSTKRFSILNEGLRKMKIAQKKYHFKDEKFNQNFHYIRTTILGYDTVLERRNQLAKELLAENLKVKNASKADIQNRMYYYFILNDQDNLTKAMAEMVEKFPDQYAIALDLSKKYFESKQYDKSLSTLEIYLKYQPNDVSALNNKKMLQEILKLN